MNCFNLIIIIVIISMFLICSLFCYDHFKPINSLNIKYNAKNVRIPKQFKKLSPKEMSLKEKINSELSSHPLTFKDQIFSFNKYPFVGAEQLCEDDNDCSTITSECTKLNDPFNRKLGIGVCTVANPDKTIFNVEY